MGLFFLYFVREIYKTVVGIYLLCGLIFLYFVRDIYKTVVGIYLLCGLVLLSLTLTVYYDIPQLNLGLHLHRHR